MALKSAWAYNNGKRWMKECLSQQKPPAMGWINGLYSEYGKIKTYSNKKQALAKIELLIAKGINVEISKDWPFCIKKIDE